MAEPLISHKTNRIPGQLPLPDPGQPQSVAPSREARLHSPWKRSACDRCRSLKLKCKRNNNDEIQECIRCTRAGATCFTGSAKTPVRQVQTQMQTQANAQAASFVSLPVGVDANTGTSLYPREVRPPVPVAQSYSEHIRDQSKAFVMRWPFVYGDPNDEDSIVTTGPNPQANLAAWTSESRRANYF